MCSFSMVSDRTHALDEPGRGSFRLQLQLAIVSFYSFFFEFLSEVLIIRTWALLQVYIVFKYCASRRQCL